MMELDYIGGPMRVTIIKQDGRNVGRIRSERGSWSVRVREGMPWKSTFNHSSTGFMTNTKVFEKKAEAVNFARDFFDNEEV
mgnify:FL=1